MKTATVGSAERRAFGPLLSEARGGGVVSSEGFPGSGIEFMLKQIPMRLLE